MGTFLRRDDWAPLRASDIDAVFGTNLSGNIPEVDAVPVVSLDDPSIVEGDYTVLDDSPGAPSSATLPNWTK